LLKAGQSVKLFEIKAEAKADLASIHAFSIDRFGDDVADIYLRGFYEAFDRLTEYPEIGSLLPIIRPPMRSLRHRSHRILYSFDSETILITRILHHSQDMQQALN
jgi:toxin ParE1/3/4